MRPIAVALALSSTVLAFPQMLEGGAPAITEALKVRAPSCSLNPCFFPVYTFVLSRDCSSFFSTIVSGCPVTATRTLTETRTAPTVTVRVPLRSTTFTTTTTTTTKVALATAVSTTVSTETDYTSTETDVSSITTTATTTTSTPTSTTTSTGTAATTYVYGGPGAPQKRDLHPFELEQRAGCTPKTTIPNSLPSYARYCSARNTNTVYQSVCSCLGVTRTVVTTSQATFTVARVTTVTITPKTTKTVTVVGDGGVTTSTEVSSITSTTSTTTATTVTEQDVTTTQTSVVSTISSTATVGDGVATSTAPTVAQRTACAIKQLTGINQGQWLQQSTSGDSGLLFLGWTTDPSQALTFYLNSSSTLYTADRLVMAVPVNDECGYLFRQSSDVSPPQYDFNTVDCTVAADDSITCVNNGNSLDTYFADANGNPALCDQSGASQFAPFTIGFDCSIGSP